MRVAVLSDVHSNLPALEAVLAAVDAVGVDEVWCLGDVVGYGAQPDTCAELIRERCEVCLVGNHDLAVLERIDVSSFSATAAAAVEWTRENAARHPGLPARAGARGERAGVGLFHGSPATRSGSTCSRSSRPKKGWTRRPSGSA